MITSMPMDFKKRIAADITKVFLDNKFFGEEVTINGMQTTVVIDEDALHERNLAIIKSGKIHTDDILFYCEKKFFKNGIPRPEKRMNFNEKEYTITSVKDDMWMLTITLQRYGGR
ncbi:hypothetical protein [Lysinibacillus alkalisoli]|nr:hypothetical protein [Lysinibacillus alkalisoli]